MLRASGVKCLKLPARSFGPECVRGTVRPVDQVGVPVEDHPAGRGPPPTGGGGGRGARPHRAEPSGTREPAHRCTHRCTRRTGERQRTGGATRTARPDAELLRPARRVDGPASVGLGADRGQPGARLGSRSNLPVRATSCTGPVITGMDDLTPRQARSAAGAPGNVAEGALEYCYRTRS